MSSSPTLEMKLKATQDELQQLKTQQGAEVKGILDLRKEFGAKNNETLHEFVARLAHDASMTKFETLRAKAAEDAAYKAIVIKAEADVLSGRACQEERRKGAGPCGVCKICLQAKINRLRAFVEALHNALQQRDYADSDLCKRIVEELVH
jgi:hypothetical protein